MEARRHSSARSFLEATEAYLRQRPVESALIYALASGASGPLDGTPWFASIHDATGTCVAAAMATPPRKALLAPTTGAGAAAVARALAEDWPSCPGVLLDTELVAPFAGAWHEVTGAAMKTGMRQRVHRLDVVHAPARPAAGRTRRAVPADVPQVTEWVAAFTKEALGQEARRPGERALEMVERQEVRLFETRDEGGAWTPRTMAAGGRAVFGGESVRWVYTPPASRGRGYASTLVTDLSRELLAGGAAWCMLYTDLDNATSNGIYAGIGYRPVQDLVDLMVGT